MSVPGRVWSELTTSGAIEDGRSEIAALQLGPGDRVLAATGSGLRVLDLLLADPDEVVATEQNPAQNALLDLHLTCVRRLDHDGWLRLIGAREDKARSARYAEIRSDLAPESRTFFDARPALIAGGALYGGRWEQDLRWLPWLTLPRRRAVRRLFGAPDLPTQVDQLERSWEGPLWSAILAFLGWQARWSRPEHRGSATSTYLQRRFRVLAQNSLLRDSPHASIAFFGSYQYQLPRTLREAHFSTLRQRVDRVRWGTMTLQATIRQAGASAFSAFAPSDFSSTCDDEEYRATWEAIRHAARPGARVCERQFLYKRTPPPIGLVRDHDLEARLDHEDDSFMYTFICGVLP